MFAPGMFFFGVLLPVAVVALIAYGVWELARSRELHAAAVLPDGSGAASARARTILDERFARGDIDAEEYVQRRALLDGTVPSPPAGSVPAATVPSPTVGGGSAPVPTEPPTAEVAIDPSAD